MPLPIFRAGLFLRNPNTYDVDRTDPTALPNQPIREGDAEMTSYEHIEVVRQDSDVTARFLDQNLTEPQVVDATARECQSVATEKDCRRLTLDCSRVRHLGSEMIGKLIMLNKALGTKNATLALCGLYLPIREALRVTQVDRLFTIRDEE
jgi:anti-anti-sigma regulatory factor